MSNDKQRIGYIHTWKDAKDKIRTHIVNASDDMMSVLVKTKVGMQQYTGQASQFWKWCEYHGIQRTIKSIEIDSFVELFDEPSDIASLVCIDKVSAIKDDIQKPTIQVYKETSEDWYPSFNLSTTHISKGLVRVSFHYPVSTNHSYMVSVWGADDCGMELQFADKEKAMDCFMNIISMKDITMSQLKELGLHNA